MATWITKLEPPADATGLRLAVKDAIDVEGVPSTVGCKAIADVATPAAADAACLAGARAANVRIVGKANLHELCFGTTGINPWFGTPVNPLDATRVPGGSSSGSAVAVAADEADVGFGTDTGGSVRIPAACCGIVGLKTTWGRIPLDGVWPLSASLDTIGPLARDVAGVVEGMRLLEPGFTVDDVDAATVVGRLRYSGVDPAVDAAVDEALRRAEVEVVELELEDVSSMPFVTIILREAWEVDHELVERSSDDVDPVVADRVRSGANFTDEQVAEAKRAQQQWTADVLALLERVQLLALPTLDQFPPTLDVDAFLNRFTSPFNLSGTPAISMPVPATGSALPASLQLVGAHRSEDLLCATASALERAVG